MDARSRRPGLGLALACIAVAMALVVFALGGCGARTGRGRGEGADSLCASWPGHPACAEVVDVRGAGGRRLGTLRKLDDFPLYEFLYEADYDLATMLGAAATGPSAAGSAADERPMGGSAFACTCFSAADISGHRVMGRNFDWDPDPVLALVTRPTRGHASISLVDIRYLGYSASRLPEFAPAALEHAPALPFDGMNDEGLAIGMMAVPHAEGAGDAARPEVDDLGLIRLILDGAATVAEAMALAGAWNVDFGSVPLHYFIADKTGDSVIVEYVGGKAVFFRGDGIWQVATNFLLSEVPADRRAASCRRYALACAELAAAVGRVPPRALLDKVSQPNTRWSSVYDLDETSLELVLGRDSGKTWSWDLDP